MIRFALSFLALIFLSQVSLADDAVKDNCVHAAHKFHEHVKNHWAAVLFVSVMALAVPFDIWLVYHGRTSISATIWNGCSEHPTLIAAGMLIACGVAYLLSGSEPCLFVWGLLCGHLFIHE